MRKALLIAQWIVLMFFLATCLLMCNGCKPLENLASNVGGWDVSACVSGLDVCWELFWDNSEKFEGGFVAAMDSLTEGG